MALVTPRTRPGVDTGAAMYAPQVAGLVAGEDLLAAAPVYIKAADGKIYMSNGTAATEPARCHGMCAEVVKAGEAVTLLAVGTRVGYATSGLTPGARLFIGATAGRLDTAATTGDAVGIAFAINATDIMFAAYKLA